MNRREFLLAVFTVLSFVSMLGAAWAVWIFIHTPLLIHDTMHVVGQKLTDQQRTALYSALLDAYRPIVLGGAVVVIAWIALTGVALRWRP